MPKPRQPGIFPGLFFPSSGKQIVAGLTTAWRLRGARRSRRFNAVRQKRVESGLKPAPRSRLQFF